MHKPDPLLSFMVDVPRGGMTPSPPKTATCTFASLQGAWDKLGRWQTPFGCPMAQRVVPKGHSICLLGDSQTAAMLWDKNGYIWRQHSPSWLGAPVLFNKIWPQHPDFAKLLQACVTFVRPQGVIVISLGSHAPAQGPHEWVALIRSVVAEVSKTYPLICIIVTASADRYHEKTPAQFGKQALFSNTWRLIAQNDAVRTMLRAYPQAHFVDWFAPSEPLHFDGHVQDPVHFYKGNFYPFQLALTAAAVGRCSWRR